MYLPYEQEKKKEQKIPASEQTKMFFVVSQMASFLHTIRLHKMQRTLSYCLLHKLAAYLVCCFDFFRHFAWGSSYLQDDPYCPFFYPLVNFLSLT